MVAGQSHRFYSGLGIFTWYYLTQFNCHRTSPLMYNQPEVFGYIYPFFFGLLGKSQVSLQRPLPGH